MNLPKPLVQAFQWPTLRTAFTVDAVVTVVDAPAVAEGRFADDPQAVAAQRRADDSLNHESPLAELFEDQLATADLIVLNKTDVLQPEALAAVEAAVRAEAPAGVKLLHAEHGRLAPELLLGLGQAMETVIDGHRTHHDAEENHNHDAFESVVLHPQVSDREALLSALRLLVERHEGYRIKGFVALPGAAMRLVVQGAGQRFDSHFDCVWPAHQPRATRLVLIGQDLDAQALQAELQLVLAGA